MNGPQFIQIKCKGYKLVHGFDAQGKEIEEVVEKDQWLPKIIAVSRIQSITEKMIRMSYSHDRIIYWEYQGGLDAFKKALNSSAFVAEV